MIAPRQQTLDAEQVRLRILARNKQASVDTVTRDTHIEIAVERPDALFNDVPQFLRYLHRAGVRGEEQDIILRKDNYGNITHFIYNGNQGFVQAYVRPKADSTMPMARESI